MWTSNCKWWIAVILKFNEQVARNSSWFVLDKTNNDTLFGERDLTRPNEQIMYSQKTGKLDWDTRSRWSVRWHDASKSWLFLGDTNDGRERLNLWRLNPVTGTSTQLTDEPYTYGYSVAPDGRIATRIRAGLELQRATSRRVSRSPTKTARRAPR